MGHINDWELVREAPLGKGGQSTVFLVRRPERQKARDASVATVRNLSGKGLDRTDSQQFAAATLDLAREDYPSELAALKRFAPRFMGPEADDSTGARLHNEIEILNKRTPGFLQLLDSNEVGKWIVTEYCAKGTLEEHLSKYKGDALGSLLAIIPLVRAAAQLHKDLLVHRDIKPQNIFIGKSGELLLGDFGLVFLPNQADRVSFTGESVGPRDFMPPWVFLGPQPPPINPAFDVYMLGKVLWCMVSGEIKLHREAFREPELDLTVLFPTDPRMHAINRVLDQCVVSRERDCISSASELLLRIRALASMMQRGGQLLAPEVPRPCHVCGIGEYIAEKLIPDRPNPTTVLSLNRITGNTGQVAGGVKAEIFTCNNCGNLQFFKVGEM